ncbi:MAG: hypothetical protein NVS2B15_10710 [Pseudarthrobacter sp.]
MSFIHHKQGRAHSGEALHGFLLRQLLRGQEKEHGPSRLHLLPRIVHVRVAAGGVDGDRGALAQRLGEAGDLVLLEGDQG